MSIFRDLPLACPACGTKHVETVAVSLNGPRVPEVVESIIDGSFHRFTCPACGSEYCADGPLIYTDFERKHWIGEFPIDWEASWAHLEHQPLDSFRRAMIDFAPAYVRAESSGFVVRAVFGLGALAEKIAVLEVGLDDRLIEVVKLVALLRLGATLHPTARPRFVRSDERGVHLLLPPATDSVIAVVDHDTVEAIAADPAWGPSLRDLATGPYVDIGRLMLDGRTDLPRAAYT
jgi:hypothetical protein